MISMTHGLDSYFWMPEGQRVDHTLPLFICHTNVRGGITFLYDGAEPVSGVCRPRVQFCCCLQTVKPVAESNDCRPHLHLS